MMTGLTYLYLIFFYLQQDKGRPLPNPASANGFTVIFSKARDEKRTTGAIVSPHTNENVYRQNEAYQQHLLKV